MPHARVPQDSSRVTLDAPTLERLFRPAAEGVLGLAHQQLDELGAAAAAGRLSALGLGGGRQPLRGVGRATKVGGGRRCGQADLGLPGSGSGSVLWPRVTLSLTPPLGLPPEAAPTPSTHQHPPNPPGPADAAGRLCSAHA